MKNKLIHWVLLWYMLLLSSCGLFSKDENSPEPNNSQFFVSADTKGTVPKLVLQGYAVAAGFGNFAALIDYDVAFYKITYNTTYKGSPVQASGLLGIPQNTPTTPALLSAQHGTMLLKSQAPSNFPATFSGFEIGAAAGFITVIPDYIGYGASGDIFHPYYDQQHSASTVIDLIKAAQYYLQQEKIAFNKNLFLLGYSEGGYVTMAAQQEIETNPEHRLTLTGVVAGAGGYDLTGMLTSITTVPVYNSPAFLAFLVQSYNTTYDWKRPLTDFFSEPYASRLPALLNGTKDIEEVNQALINSPTSLLNPTFYANLQNPSGETAFKQVLIQNSFLDWIPKSPTRLYHGTADENVFFETSVTTFNRFKAAGANNLEFIPLEGGTHQTSIEPMMVDALDWIRTLDK